MAGCSAHQGHKHEHGLNCEHPGVKHEGHVDYLHDGCLHHPHGDHVDEHAIKVDDEHPLECTPGHGCEGHEEGHEHGPDCGHPAIPHGDHQDYVVDGHLHHPHADHCDTHGEMTLI